MLNQSELYSLNPIVTWLEKFLEKERKRKLSDALCNISIHCYLPSTLKQNEILFFSFTDQFLIFLLNRVVLETRQATKTLLTDFFIHLVSVSSASNCVLGLVLRCSAGTLFHTRRRGEHSAARGAENRISGTTPKREVFS